MRTYGSSIKMDHPVLVLMVAPVHGTQPDEAAVVISRYLLSEPIEQRS